MNEIGEIFSDSSYIYISLIYCQNVRIVVITFSLSVQTGHIGSNERIMGKAHVRVRVWKQSSLPAVDFKQSGIQIKANTSKGESTI